MKLDMGNATHFIANDFDDIDTINCPNGVVLKVINPGAIKYQWNGETWEIIEIIEIFNKNSHFLD